MMSFSSPKPIAWNPEARTPDRERRVSEEARREIRRFDELAKDVVKMLADLPQGDPIRERIMAILREGKKLTDELEIGS